MADAAFEVKFDVADVEATGELDLDMFFTPHSGQDYVVRLTLTAENTAPGEETATITLLGKGQGGACDLPAVLDFGQVPVGDRFTLSVDLQNPGAINGSATVGDIMGVDAPVFDITPKGSVGVPAMTTAKVTVGFSPTQKRDYTATVTLKPAGDCPEQTVTLKGSGADDVLTWAPVDLDYGYVSPSVEAPRQVIFTNTSNVPITLTQVVTSMPTDFLYRDPAGTGSTDFIVPGGGVPLRSLSRASRPASGRARRTSPSRPG